MLRSNGNRGKIRTGNRLFVPDCTVDATETRRSPGNVFAMSFGHSRFVISSWQVKSSFKDLHRGCWVGPTAVLDAIFALAPSNDTPPSPNGANFLRHEDLDGLKRFVASWSGHAQWANTHNLNTWMENRYGIAFNH